MPPRGANLPLDDLLLAVKWKLENGDDEGIAYEIENFTDAQRKNWADTWSQRIDASKHIIILFQHRLNALPIINRLPIEILGEIFLDLQKEYRNTSFDLPRAAPNLKDANSWIKITHVCRRWRRVAQNIKALWSRITLNESLLRPGYLAKTFFALSHPLPITLEHELGQLSHSEEAQMNKFYGELLEYPQRIAALYLRGHFPDVAWTLIQTALPNLVDIELHFKVIDRNPLTDEITPARNGRVENFLGGHSSFLQKISLQNYVWPRQSFRTLTHLYLTNEFDDWLNASDLYEILHLTSATLQFLYSRGATPFMENPEQFHIRPTIDRIPMPALRHFEVYPPRLDYEFYWPLLLLQNLSIPKDATIVWDWRISEYKSEYTPSPRGLSLMPPHEHLGRVKHLVSWAPQTDVYVLSGNTLHVDASHVTLFSLVDWWTYLPNVTTLALREKDFEGYGIHSEQESIFEALGRCNTLKSLHISSIFSFSLTTMLRYFETGQEDEICPHLETVTLYAGKASIQWIQKDAEEEFEESREQNLEPLRISTDNSCTRNRPHLQSTYTLRFKTGDIDELTFQN